jgi:hypothetical protein
LAYVNPKLKLGIICHRGIDRIYKALLGDQQCVVTANVQLYGELLPVTRSCPYCGNVICSDIHSDIKLLEIWNNKGAWIPLGYDLFVSFPQMTSIHSARGEKFFLIFLIDIGQRKIITFNAATRTICTIVTFHADILDTFIKQYTQVLPLHVWAVRGLVKKGCNLSNLGDIVPTTAAKHYQLVNTAIQSAAKCRHLGYLTLHQWHQEEVQTR